MKALWIATSLMLIGASGFADNNKVGQILLNGKVLPVAVQESNARGVITVGKDTFEVFGGGISNVEGRQILTLNGKNKIDRNITVQFQPMNTAELAGAVDNKGEVACDKTSNAVILISDNITMGMVGNCLTLNNK